MEDFRGVIGRVLNLWEASFAEDVGK